MAVQDIPVTTNGHLPTRPSYKLDLPKPTYGTISDSLVGAAAVLSSATVDRGKVFTSSSAWQREAWRYLDLVGELSFCVRYDSNAISRCRLIAAIDKGDASEPEPLPSDHEASQLVASLFGGSIHSQQAMSQIATQFSVVGLSYVAIIPAEGESPPKFNLNKATWHVLSDQEVILSGSGASAQWELTIEGAKRKFRIDTILMVRLWQKHPRDSWEPNSQVLSLLPVLSELEGLSQHVAATIDSRLAGAGILVLPQEMTFRSSGDDVPEGEDPFIWTLLQAASMAIKDRDSASALVPIVVKVPAETIQHIQHIKFATPLDAEVPTLRESCIRRIALGMDYPPEILLGLGDASRWSGWQVEETALKLHTEPKLQTICESLTAGFLTPILGKKAFTDAGRIIVWYDTTLLKLRPNRAADATVAHDRLLISDVDFLEALGYDESALPTPEQKKDMILRYVLVNAPQLALELLPLFGIKLPERAAAGRGPNNEPDDGNFPVGRGADPKSRQAPNRSTSESSTD